MKYYAHSPKDGIPAQTYADHIAGVSHLAKQFAKEVAEYSKHDGAILAQITETAAEHHDLGKLDEDNQKVLSGELKKRSLSVNHVDAGAAYCWGSDYPSTFSAIVIQAHHVGFPNFSAESNRGELAFRDAKIAKTIDRELPSLLRTHHSLFPLKGTSKEQAIISGDQSIFLRVALSCIADADHTNTAQHYGKYPKEIKYLPLRAEERLSKLDHCISNIQKNSENSDRNILRNQMYLSCREADANGGISSCDSPVGSGKTTAVMAHLLSIAKKRGLRRIFIILPFTNIIQQSVKTYRKMLTLPGENPEEVVAELHHRADFESLEARALTALWRAPIVVTTAVAFFETLASNSPATLRRLHELPGSAIFVDESHAALPSYLLPIAWQWMKVFSQEWGCYWVLASGSLCRFWTINEIAGETGQIDVPEITDDTVRSKLAAYEINRITYRYDPKAKDIEALAKWVSSFPGPRLVILNTIQSAAYLADKCAQLFGRDKVEHLSTALTSQDREKTLERIKSRLKNKSDSDWTLVATSCVEAGVDFSFKIGFRELSSLASLLQLAGRVNREGEYINSDVWTFRIYEDGKLKLNPGLSDAGEILKDYFEQNKVISPALTTTSISEEIRRNGKNRKNKTLVDSEVNQNFIDVENEFKVIDSDTRLTVIDSEIASEIQSGKIDWQKLQKVSVQISKYKLDVFQTPILLDNIYRWTLGYDDFLGYMAGIIKNNQSDGQLLIY